MQKLRPWREHNRARINNRALTLKSAMQTLPNWKIEAMGAYFAYVRHPWHNRSSLRVAEYLAEELGIITLPGEFFGPEQQAYLRLAFANVESDVIDSLQQRLNK